MQRLPKRSSPRPPELSEALGTPFPLATGSKRKRSRCGRLAAALTAVMLLGPMPFNATKADTPQPAHRVVILIDSDDLKVMGHAISYSTNIARAYAARHERVTIEVVANGAGITLFRRDKSPLQAPLESVRLMIPGIVFSMCDSSRRIAEQREGHPIELIPQAHLVPFGIGRVIELEEQGWSYIHG